ncbi:hypothetical protein BSKO_12744 [Bryopsis sp. KO-2023]|nr:hypothetical protein BSKO_05548 [Bryopsis sp. KO-2023]GMH42201.1 hypothetical protein BSKO_10120 [Bryopsis sp. KO-2023]GMH42936.1 hypothetical protein BSKO_10858 [Bryopsis sp. KO-2023]GMH44792.1 hypothetical protein BSKO_12744 [Bryopsis sp. KO-2023]
MASIQDVMAMMKEVTDREKAEATEKAAAAERKAVEAERKAVEAERKAVEAEGKLAAAEGKAVQAERMLEAAEGRAVEAERKLEAAEGKAVQAEGKLEEVATKLEEVETKLEEAESKVVDKGSSRRVAPPNPAPLFPPPPKVRPSIVPESAGGDVGSTLLGGTDDLGGGATDDLGGGGTDDLGGGGMDDLGGGNEDDMETGGHQDVGRTDTDVDTRTDKGGMDDLESGEHQDVGRTDTDVPTRTENEEARGTRTKKRTRTTCDDDSKPRSTPNPICPCCNASTRPPRDDYDRIISCQRHLTCVTHNAGLRIAERAALYHAEHGKWATDWELLTNVRGSTGGEVCPVQPFDKPFEVCPCCYKKEVGRKWGGSLKKVVSDWNELYYRESKLAPPKVPRGAKKIKKSDQQGQQ